MVITTSDDLSPRPDVLIVEDHRLLADGLAASLGDEGLRARVLVPARADDVLTAAQSAAPGIVLLDLDLGLPDGDGTSLVRDLTEAGAAVVVLTGSRDVATLGSCLLDGALGVARKTDGFDAIVDLLRAVLAGRPLPGSAQREELAASALRARAERRRVLAPLERLSAREAEVLRALADGYAAETIAAMSYVSLTTVRTQIRSILTKLGVNSQLAAVAMARRAGWLERSSALTM